MNTPMFDLDYILAVISAQHRLRSEATGAEIGYLKRLLSFKKDIDSAETPVVTTLSPPPRGKRISAWIAFFKLCFGALRLFPASLAQGRELRALANKMDSKRALVVALATNRIQLNEKNRSPRLYFRSLVKVLGSAQLDDIDLKIKQAKVIFLFDALPISRLWQFKERCWNERVYIVDAVFISALVAGEFLRHPWGYCRRLLALSKSARQVVGRRTDLQAITPSKAFQHAVVADAYARVVDQYALESYLVTSNSMLTELLRAFLIQRPGNERIVEIMHGVGSLPSERFCSFVLREGAKFSADKRHFFIPQLPYLPYYGVFRRQLIGAGDFAINAYLNNYFIRAGQSGISIPAYIRTECEKLCQSPKDSGEPLVITIFGCDSNAGKSFTSPSFRSECLFMSVISEFRRKTGLRCLVLYVPHPMQASNIFDHPVFGENDIKIYRDSVFCWLISDLCVSLLSSTMFEATYFGVQAFTAMIPEDELYPEAYLSTLNYPRSERLEDFISSFRGFLSANAKPSRSSLVDRALSRLTLTSWGTADSTADRPSGEMSAVRRREV
jgi:hypothetical protein